MTIKYTFKFSDPAKGEFSLYPYTSDGTVSPTDPTLLDTAVVATTSLKLYGKEHQEYGEGIEQNLIYMLENFAGPIEPLSAIEGQLWYKNTIAGVGSPPSNGEELFIRNKSNDWTGVILATGTTPMTGELILSGNPSNPLGAAPKQYIDDHINSISAGYNLHLTAAERNFLSGIDYNLLSAQEVMQLDGITGNIQTQLDTLTSTKLNRSGSETFSGTSFTFSSTPVTISGGDLIFQSGSRVFGLLDPIANDEPATKNYVETRLASGDGGDGKLAAVEWTTPTGTTPVLDNETSLKFTVIFPDGSFNTINVDGISRITHTHIASDVSVDTTNILPSMTDVQLSIDLLYNDKAPKVSPVFTGTATFDGDAVFNADITATGKVTIPEPVNNSDAATKRYVDTAISGISGGISGGTGSVNITRTLEQTTTTISAGTPTPVQAHVVGTNKLQIYLNGLKATENKFGLQNILFDPQVNNLSDSNDYTGLETGVAYYFDISVDGAAPVTITLSTTLSLTTFPLLIGEINNQLTTAGVPAKFIIADDDTMVAVSNSSGSTSSISILQPTSGTATYLFELDAAPITIVGADFNSGQFGSPVLPDFIYVSGDVTATFVPGKIFTIRNADITQYGEYNGIYRVHTVGSFYDSVANQTKIAVGNYLDYTAMQFLLGNYIPSGSPTPTPPTIVNYGEIHQNPLGGLNNLAIPENGVDGDYHITDSAGNAIAFAELGDYAVFTFDITTPTTIETLLYS